MARRLALILTIPLLVAQAPALAQTGNWPAPDDLFVNDHAAIIEAAAEDRLRAALSALRAETGVEMTVVTIARRSDYGYLGLFEDFATDLFNAWSVGDATRNDGILVLVAHRDREMRLELGAGYARDWDRVARDVVEESFLPLFREDRYSEGIETGTMAAIARIARPHAAGKPPGSGSGTGGWGAGLLPPLLFAAFFLAVAFRRRLGDLGLRVRRCPGCGHRGLHRSREVIRPATGAEVGEGRQVTSCPACGRRDTKTYPISHPGGSSGGFGGGKSSGGGASGRW
ncbi:TPM domain-containing protein [Rhodovulum steppense]|uniref:TPM domain-containing protein n=1 Tax=Rhodovulum steppense TaxID=540251 RepID=A0A4V2R4F7_9RHOB|nr:TPM domain-containing protein [Rhodovulum steppense]TCM84694.1 uncharacterized protein EV216_11010 [Rhodovulum steppense]